jgi:hypothetical protein
VARAAEVRWFWAGQHWRINGSVSGRAKKRGAGNFSRASLPYALNFLRRLFIPPRLEADRFFVQRNLNVKKIS